MRSRLRSQQVRLQTSLPFPQGSQPERGHLFVLDAAVRDLGWRRGRGRRRRRDGRRGRTEETGGGTQKVPDEGVQHPGIELAYRSGHRQC